MHLLRPVFLVAASILALSSCRENAGPLPTKSNGVRAEVRHLLWQPGTTFRAAALAGETKPHFSPLAATPPVLSNYQVSFYARADEDRSIEVDYFAADGTWRPFMVFTVPAGALARLPDGSAVQPGDSVFITASINDQRLDVGLEPSGLTFNDANPAKLTMWYTGADRDFDGNGVIDDADSYIEQNLLGLWVQATANSPWATMPAVQSLALRSFVADIRHFTGYTLSW